MRELTPKRLFGYANWRLRRRRHFDHRRFEVLLKQLQALQIDRLLITGDLTQLGLAEEFEEVRFWLKQLERVTPTMVLPGNHDLYAPSSYHHLPSWCSVDFPVAVSLGEVALLGLNSALPLPFPYAAGELDDRQLQHLEAWLQQNRHRFRIVALHHPPYPQAVSPRKALRNTDRLLAILKKHRCELILHGHSHRWQLHWLFGEIPTFGLPPTLYESRDPRRRARFHIYEISPPSRFAVAIYGWQGKRFQLETRLRFSLTGPRNPASPPEFQSQPTRSNKTVGRSATSQAGTS